MLAGSFESFDAIGAKVPEIFAELTVGGERPGSAPKVESERSHRAPGALARFADVRKAQARLLVDGVPELGEVPRAPFARTERKTEQGRARQLVSLGIRQYGTHLLQNAAGRATQLAVAPGFDHAHAHHQRFDLLGLEHQRRQAVAWVELIADARFAEDGNAGKRQILHIAVDRAR